jgi:hypothetical protein
LGTNGGSLKRFFFGTFRSFMEYSEGYERFKSFLRHSEAFKKAQKFFKIFKNFLERSETLRVSKFFPAPSIIFEAALQSIKALFLSKAQLLQSKDFRFPKSLQ